MHIGGLALRVGDHSFGAADGADVGHARPWRGAGLGLVRLQEGQLRNSSILTQSSARSSSVVISVGFFERVSSCAIYPSAFLISSPLSL